MLLRRHLHVDETPPPTRWPLQAQGHVGCTWYTRCSRRDAARRENTTTVMTDVEIVEDEASANMAMISNEVRDSARVYVAAC